MLYHPNMWIRYGVIALMAAIASQLKLADIHCFLIPVLKSYLITEIIDINEMNLLEALKPPVCFIRTFVNFAGFKDSF